MSRDVVVKRDEILKVVPYGPSFCFIDRIIKVFGKGGQAVIQGEYTVKTKDCEGHFENISVFPGIKKQEAIAQLGVYWLRTQPGFQNHLAMYSGKYQGEDIGVVLPGDRLELKFQVIEFDGKKRGKAEGFASVNGKIVQTFKFAFRIMSEKALKRILSKRQR